MYLLNRATLLGPGMMQSGLVIRMKLLKLCSHDSTKEKRFTLYRTSVRVGKYIRKRIFRFISTAGFVELPRLEMRSVSFTEPDLFCLSAVKSVFLSAVCLSAVPPGTVCSHTARQQQGAAVFCVPRSFSCAGSKALLLCAYHCWRYSLWTPWV